MKKPIIGYTTGVFDLFHIGHLNLLRKAKEKCDYLIVGVTSDKEVYRVKDKWPVIPQQDRKEIISSLSCVDFVVYENSVDKLKAWETLRFDILFKGSDWKNTDLWNYYEQEFEKLNVDIIYFDYTQNVSTTKIKEKIQNGL